MLNLNYIYIFFILHIIFKYILNFTFLVLNLNYLEFILFILHNIINKE